MSIGISTSCFYPMETENALLLLAESGIKTTEIFFNTDSELRDDFLRLLLEIKEQYGLHIAAVHPFTSLCEPFLLFSEYPRRFDDALEYYKKYFHAAARLGAGVLVFHGGYKKYHLNPDMYADRLSRLMREAEQYGVIFAHENVNLHSCADPDYIRLLKKRLPELKFVLDVKQTVRSGYKPEDIIEAIGPAIAHVHLSDHTGEEHCLLPGKGGYDFAALFQTLRAFGYKGDCVVEVYKAAFHTQDELIASARYMEKVWQNA